MEDASATSETMVDASEAFVNAGFDADALIAALEAATGMPLPAIAAVALFVMATIFWILARVLFGSSREGWRRRCGPSVRRVRCR